jgi:hypothetical protein
MDWALAYPVYTLFSLFGCWVVYYSVPVTRVCLVSRVFGVGESPLIEDALTSAAVCESYLEHVQSACWRVERVDARLPQRNAPSGGCMLLCLTCRTYACGWQQAVSTVEACGAAAEAQQLAGLGKQLGPGYVVRTVYDLAKKGAVGSLEEHHAWRWLLL